MVAPCQGQSASGSICYPLEADAEVGEEQDISSDSLQNRMGRFRWVQPVNGGSHNENTTGADMRQDQARMQDLDRILLDNYAQELARIVDSDWNAWYYMSTQQRLLYVFRYSPGPSSCAIGGRDSSKRRPLSRPRFSDNRITSYRIWGWPIETLATTPIVSHHIVSYRFRLGDTS